MHYQLKITLTGTAPAVWRRVVVPIDFTLGDLHNVIHAVMGRDVDEHLHEFQVKRQKYSPDTGLGDLDEWEAVLGAVVKPRSKFEYVYDLGASWRHEIVVEKKVDAETSTPQCVAGSRASPPDGCDAWTFDIAVRQLRSRNEDTRLEAEEQLGGDFDPKAFDRDATNRKLKRMFRAASANPR